MSSGWVLSLARSSLIESGDEGWSAWSSGLRFAGCGLSRGWRLGRSVGGRGCIGRRSGKALQSPTPPSYSRPSRGSKLDSSKDQILELLREDPEIESQRIREIVIESGFDGGKTIVDDYVREVRPFFGDQRTFQRTVYRLGDVLQFDLWQPKREIPVGYDQTRKGYVVVGVLGYSRFGRRRAGVL